MAILSLSVSAVYGQEPLPSVDYSTYYGGTGTDDADVVAIDPFGNIYLGCHSTSPSLPGVNENHFTLKGGMDAFVVKLNEKGSEVGYVTHLGGANWDAVQGLVSDSAGSIYAIGTTYSEDFPIDPNGFQSTFAGESDAFVLKLNTNGEVVWSTFLGGSGDEDGRGIIVDRHGVIHIIGRTKSNDFPTVAGALQPQSAGGVDAFIATLDPDGKVIASTYLGGAEDDIGFAIALDSVGRRYITGTTNSADFPVRNGVQMTHNGENDLFVVVVDSMGSNLEFASYLGGSGADQAYSLALGPAGDIYVMGVTNSPDLPATKGAFQQEPAGERDAFVARLNLQTRSLVYATYVGGENDDNPRNLVVDSAGRAWIVGNTSSHNFPVLSKQNTAVRGRADAFVTILDPTGELLEYSTLLGGDGFEIFEGAALGADGSLTVSGLTDSANFPRVNPLQHNFMGGRFDIVVARFTMP
ncbi:MAG: SBBP repeat-containing protein [Calditrichia bacterium]